MTVNKNIEKKSNVPRPRGGPQVELGGGVHKYMENENKCFVKTANMICHERKFEKFLYLIYSLIS